MFQFLDVLLAVEFHLFHDLLLSVDFTFKVLLLSEGVIQCILQVLVLLRHDLIGFLSGLELDLNIFGEEHLIFKVASLL